METFDCNVGKNDIVSKETIVQVARKKESAADAKATQDEKDGESDGDDVDYDDFDALEAIRAKRLAALKAKRARRNRNRQFGEYREIVESEFLDTVTKNEKAVVHFFHREFQRCRIMDQQLGRVAHCHDDVTFAKLNAEKSPFFVTKLKIKTLPTVVLFVNGVAKDRIVGFEGLDGGRDTFRARALENRLVRAGLVLDGASFGTYPDDRRDDSDSDEE